MLLIIFNILKCGFIHNTSATAQPPDNMPIPWYRATAVLFFYMVFVKTTLTMRDIF